MKIKEVIVVEGRDDTTAVTRALDCDTIETHGFGIRKQTWDLIEKAYNSRGIIIFTDPDHSGEEIRRKLTAKFPDAKHAYLARKDAYAHNDIGIENANDEAIIEALKKAKAVTTERCDQFSAGDLQKAGLTGMPESKTLRQELGKALGIGYGNGNGFLKKLNSFGITKEQFDKELAKVKERI